MLIIGSEALIKAGVPMARTPKDCDVIATMGEIRGIRGVMDVLRPFSSKKYYGERNNRIWEFEIAEDNNSAQQLLDILNVSEHIVEHASPDVCYALKMSHRFLKNSPHFHKTMRDIHFLRELGCEVPEYLKDWMKLRENETYNYSHPKLNVNKGDFFKDDNINYLYDHDSLHEAVRLYHKPAYQFFKKDGEDVLCDKDKFSSLPFEFQIAAVYEESSVLALERAVIPNDVEAEKAFKIALMKVCTSITSGWFREFSWEHHDEALEIFYTQEKDYVDKFFEGIENGVVTLHNGQEQQYA